ncbi:cupin-like domain-containing protein, partial [Syncephalis pseudoplumigaleata]
IQILDQPPTPLEFHRYVAANRPVLIRNAMHHWPAFDRWQRDSYLVSALGATTSVTVAATPNGYADAVVDGHWFAEPAERSMPFGDFIRTMRAELADESMQYPGVHYVQSQNGNLGGEFAPLAADVPADIEFATAALAKQPDAVNFWMGTGRSVTSLHKDPYENVYAVISGAKHFTLFPPTSQPCLYERLYERARYDAATLALVPAEPRELVPWIPIDPDCCPAREQYPCYHLARPLRVTVQPGEVLYLPSMWYHHVRQQGRTVAVNWWYDMEYGANYAYLMLVRGI